MEINREWPEFSIYLVNPNFKAIYVTFDQAYYIFSYYGPIIFTCVISLPDPSDPKAQKSADQMDFETNYQPQLDQANPPPKQSPTLSP